MDENRSKKKVKGSKKSKKSWRKKTDIEDVEEHLEETRRDERTGGAVADKESESLFFIDKNEDAVKLIPIGIQPDVAGSSDDDEEDYVPRKQKRNQRIKEELQKEQEMRKSERNNPTNLWGEKKVEENPNSYLEPTIKKAKVKPKSFDIGKSGLDVIEKPNSGVSYNPDYNSHQELLQQAHTVELNKLKEQNMLNKKVKMVTKSEMKKKTRQWLKEMSEGLTPKEDGNLEEEIEENADVIINNPINPLNRKTMRERRKVQEQKEIDSEKSKEKQEKRKLHEIERIKSLKREIQRENDKTIKRKKMRALKEERNVILRTKRLSKHKYKDPEIVVQLSEDLTGSLRQLKPEGNLIEERFKSLQKRNIIESRKPVIPHRKYKKKVVVKRSYKTDTIKDFKPKGS